MSTQEINQADESQMMMYFEPELDEMEDISLCAAWLNSG